MASDPDHILNHRGWTKPAPLVPPSSPTGPDQSDSSITARENLSLDSIDSERETAVSWEILVAARFAFAGDHRAQTVHRFVTALTMTDNLTRPGMWPHILKTVTDLEAQERQERNPAP